MDKRASQPVVVPATPDEVTSLVGDISQTRASMSSTVNEIEQRLSPAHLKEQISEIKDSALGQYHEAKDHLKDDLVKEFQEAKGRLEQEMMEARLKINHEIEQAKQAVHDATVGRVEHMVHDAQETVIEAKTTVFEVVRANPIPAALVAVGLGWLIMSARSSGGASGARRVRARRETRGYEPPAGYGYTYAAGSRNEYARLPAGRERDQRGGQSALDGAFHDVQSGVAKLGHRIGEGASEVGHKVQEVGHKVQEGASELAHQAQGAVHTVGETVAHLAHQASEGVGHIAHEASEGVGALAHRASEGVGSLAHETRSAASHLATNASVAGQRVYRGVESGVIRAEEGFESALRANPLAVGAIALTVGVAVGLALPHTEREDEWLGETRDRLVDRAQHVAHDVLEAAEHRVESLAGELAPNQGQQRSGSEYGSRTNA